MKGFRKTAVAVCLVFFAAMALGSGSTSDSSPTKVGEVSSETGTSESAAASSQETETETVSESVTLQTEYHVGDVLKDGNMQIVYVASGVYQSDNQFLQPKEGNKYIFIELALENQGQGDASVSTFSFECYADGYSCDQFYGNDDDLSATLSPGRTTSGKIVFEVPEDAEEIEIEYDSNFFTNDKITFVYEGEAESGYVAEAKTEASENAYAVGDVVEAGGVKISYLSCETDTDYDIYSAPEAGYHYVTLTFEFENIGSSDEFVSAFEFDAYADGKNCDMSYHRDDAVNATLSAGRKAKGTVSFKVPDDASVVEVEYLSNAWTSERVVFATNE